MKLQSSSLKRAVLGGLIAASVQFLASDVRGANATWNVLSGAGPHNWDANASWNPNNTFPNGVGERARFDVNFATANTVINLNSSITIGRMDVGDTTSTFRSITYAPGTAGTLTFDASSGNAILTKASTASTQTDTISAPVILNDNLDATNNAVNAPIVISGNITEIGGPRSLTKLGNGTLTLSGTNSYTGTTTVSAGILAITTPAALYNNNSGGGWTSGNILVSTGAMLNLSYGGSGFTDSDIATLSGLVGYSAGSYLGLNTTAGSATLTSNITHTDVILTKTGTNTLTLTGTNNVKTAVQAGTLQFSNTNTLFAGNNANWTDTNFGVVSGATAIFNAGGVGEFTGSDIATLATVGTATGGFMSNSTIGIDTTNATGDTTISGTIANPNAGANVLNITKFGGNNLVLAAANTYTGTTTLASGGLVLAHTNALQNSTLNNTGGTLSFSSAVVPHNFTIGGLTGSGPIDLQDNALNPVNLSIGNNTASFSGTISGPGGLTKIGNGTQAFTGTNTFTGVTTINSGAIIYNSLAAISGNAVADVTVNSGGTASAALSLGIDQSFLQRIVSSSTGVVAVGSPSANALDFSADTGANLGSVSLGATGAQTFTGTITPHGMTYRLGGGTSNGNLTLSNQNALTGANSVVFDVNGTSTSSSVTIANSNDYTGDTILNSGTLVISGPTLGSANPTTTGQLGTGRLILNGGKIDSVNTNNAPSQAGQTHTLANNIVVNGTTQFTGIGQTTSVQAHLTFTGTVSGTGTINVTPGSPLPSSPHAATITFSGSLISGADGPFTGTFEHVAGDTSGASGAGALSSTLVLSGAAVDASAVKFLLHGFQLLNSNGKSLRFDTSASGGIAKLGELSGDGGMLRGVSAPSNIEIGYLNTSTSYAGGFGEVGAAVTSLVKVGSGDLTLSNVKSSYTGTTTVRAGGLILTEDVTSTVLGGAIATTGWNNTSDVITTGVAHGFAAGDTVQLGNGAPDGTDVSSVYYVLPTNLTATTFKLSLSPNGTSANLTGTSEAGVVLRVSTLGASASAIELGDGGSTTSTPITLRMDASKIFVRPINVNATAGASITTIGGGTDTNPLFSGNINLAKDVNLTSASVGPNAVTFSGVISGTGFGISKVGTGVVKLTGDNTYSGATTISSGTLQIGDGGTSGTLGSGAIINNGTLAFNRSDAVNVSIGISGLGDVQQIGTGTTNLSAANTYTGNTTVNGGILNVASSGSITTPTGNLTVGDGAFVVAGSASVQNTLNDTGTGTIHVQSTGSLTSNNLRVDVATVDGTTTIRANGGVDGASQVETLTVGASGKLNLKDNDLVVGTAANVDAVRTAIVAGKANNAASGITSDFAAFGTTTGFGYAMGNDAAISPLLAGSLSGQSYDSDSVLVKYTFLGDADLDGDSDLNDLGLWAQAFTGDLGNPVNPATYWTSGDFDYDGDTDLNDLGFWAGTFTGDLGGGAGSLIVVAPGAPAGAVAALNSMGITVVPEPSTFVLAGVGLAGLAIAARRRKK